MKKTNGFSLMETMIVLLIVSVIAAASAPMINKKMVSAASDKSPWVWVGGKNIAYNLRNENLTASIGAITSGTGARLHILTDDDKPQMSLGYQNSNDWRLFAKDSSLNLSTSKNTPSSSVLIGEINSNSNLDDNNSNITAIGSGITPADNSVVVGSGAQAGASGVAVGSSAQAASGVGVGYNAKAGELGVAIGRNARIEGQHSIVIGASENDKWPPSNLVKGDNSIAIGYSSKIVGLNDKDLLSNSTALGAYSQAQNSNSTALGASSQAKTQYSTTIGYNAIDYDKITTDDQLSRTAIGAFAKASGNYSIALGGGDGHGGNDSWTQAKAANSIAIGRGADALSTNAIAIGRASIAGAEASKQLLSPKNSIAIGYKAQATGDTSMAIGPSDESTNSSTQATAANSIAIGRAASATHENSVAIGYGATTLSKNQIVLGDENTDVYIPGRLMVYGTSYLSYGRDGGIEAWIRGTKGSSSFPTGRHVIKLRYQNTDGEEIRIDSAKNISTSNSATFYWNDEGFQDRTTSSDRRLKDVGKAFKGGLDEIKKLEVFNYTFKKDKSKTPRVGVMAQDLEKIFPNAVFKGEDGFLRIRMEDIFYAMVNAIKELDSKISILEQKQKKIDELESKVTKLEKRLADLEKKIK